MTSPEVTADPALTVAIALAVGMIAQAVARHLRIPGIVLLLALGALLGPEGVGWVQPKSLGEGLHMLVGFAVAIVLFEGGLNLRISLLRHQAGSIRRLVTWGALITAIGGALTARFVLGWEWRLSVLFGTLVIVTGPTVISPLVRRLRLRHKVATVLEAEGVFGDAIGALVAVVTLEVILAPSRVSWTDGASELLVRLGVGVLLGAFVGLLLAALLRNDYLIPSGFDNVFSLAIVLLLYQGSNWLLPESGVVAVIAAGMTVANFESRLVEELREFKEQLTVLMLGMLFILLAADVGLEDIIALGWRGLVAVAVLMFIVRPINVLVSTQGSDLDMRERAFIAWLAPRGIVAAAIASLFAQSLETAGIEGGQELRAMVFLVIAVTVTFLGLSSIPLSHALGLRREDHSGYAILGANALGRLLGRLIRDGGGQVVLLDSNPTACKLAEEDGFRVVWGSALAETVLTRARLEGRAGCIAVTANDEVNFSFARRARNDFKVPDVWVALDRTFHRISESMLREIDGHHLFGGPRNMGRWVHMVEMRSVEVESWTYTATEAAAEPLSATLDSDLATQVLILMVDRGKHRLPFDQTMSPRPGDRLWLAVVREHRAAVDAWLSAHNWIEVQEPETGQQGDATS
jgi:NhaP-type Na+/H+ or K+/H+ antiporter